MLNISSSKFRYDVTQFVHFLVARLYFYDQAPWFQFGKYRQDFTPVHCFSLFAFCIFCGLLVIKCVVPLFRNACMCLWEYGSRNLSTQRLQPVQISYDTQSNFSVSPKSKNQSNNVVTICMSLYVTSHARADKQQSSSSNMNITF